MKKRIFAGLLACLLTLGLLPVTAFATETPATPPSTTVGPYTITVNFLHDGKTPIAGSTFRAYHVANWTGGGYEGVGKFADLDWSKMTKDMSKEDLTTFGNNLKGIIDANPNDVRVAGEATTNASGTAIIDRLTETGLYFIVGTPVKIGNTTYTPGYSYAYLPDLETGDHSTTVAPKSTDSTTNPPSGSTKISLHVIKIWADGDGEARPASITVQLMRNGQPYGDPVELNAENNWRHTWNNLPSGGEYWVVETTVPDGYTVSVDRSGNTFTVTNTKPEAPPPPPDEPTPPPPPDTPTPPPSTPDVPKPPEKLPQTGLLWWPVPILAGSGVVLLFLGLTLARREDDDD